MPSVLSPTALQHHQHDHKSYAPLADEINPPFGNIAPAPTVTRNGTVVYSSKRGSTHSSRTASPIHVDINEGYQHKNDSQETLSAVGGSYHYKRKMVVDMQGDDDGGDGDLGEMRRATSQEKGKGKERAWDVEQGVGIHHDGNGNGNGHGGFVMGNNGGTGGGLDAIDEGEGVYPPLNEVEQEEKRIQDNLARFAAKEAARRRAARESKMLPSSPTPNPAFPRSSSSTSSVNRRPFSVVSANGSVNKRASFIGLVEGLWSGKKENWADGELPMSNSSNQPYTNPYDTQPAFSPIPKMVISPTSPPQNSPFADPQVGPSNNRHSIVASNINKANVHDRRASLTTTAPYPLPISERNGSSPQSPPQAYSPLASPTDGVGFSYSGPSWRGGAAQDPNNVHNGTVAGGAGGGGGERWWHAICSWGNDLDGGHGEEGGNQAGRTNPFE